MRMTTGWALAFFGMMAAYAVGTAGAVTSHQPWGLRAAGLLWPMVAILLALVGTIACLGASAICGARRRWRGAAAGLLLAVTWVCGTWWSLSIVAGSCQRSWARVAKNGAPLVAAVRAYEKDHGHAPGSLQALVPEYLPRLPETGVACHPWFRPGPRLGPASPSGWSLEVMVAHAGGPVPLLVYWPEGHYPPTVGSGGHVDGWFTAIQDGWAHFQPSD